MLRVTSNVATTALHQVRIRNVLFAAPRSATDHRCVAHWAVLLKDAIFYREANTLLDI